MLLSRGAWVAQFIEHPTSAEVVILGFVSSSPALSSLLTPQSLEPASEPVTPSLSAPHARSLALSLSVSQKINIKKKKVLLSSLLFEQMCVKVLLLAGDS